jgi:hypothetical protein
MRLKELGKLKDVNNLIGSRNRDLLTCSLVPQTTRQPLIKYKISIAHISHDQNILGRNRRTFFFIQPNYLPSRHDSDTWSLDLTYRTSLSLFQVRRLIALCYVTHCREPERMSGVEGERIKCLVGEGASSKTRSPTLAGATKVDCPYTHTHTDGPT